MNREACYSKLFQWVSDRTTIPVTKTRRLEHWDQVPPANMPYLAQVQTKQETIRTPGKPNYWRLHGKFYVYAHSEEIALPPAVILNNILDELDTALGRDLPLNNLTLGTNFIYDCGIEGEVETDDGLLGSLVVAIVPYIIVAT